MTPEELEAARTQWQDLVDEIEASIPSSDEVKDLIRLLIGDLINHVDFQASQIKQLKQALLWSRAEYIHTLDTNPDCSAWDLDELSEEEQKPYLDDALFGIAYEDLGDSFKEELDNLRKERKLEP